MLFSSIGISPAKAAPAGTALQFNGSSQYATLGTAIQLRSATFTVELWFKRTGAGVGTGTGSGGITSAIPLITKGRAEAETAAADVNYFFGIDATSGKLVADFEEAQVAQGGTSPGLNHPITGTAVIAADSAWHHAAATYDGATWNLYLDGVLDGTLSVSRPANALTNALTSVGSARTTGGVAAGFFAGAVDEVRIWNVARSLAQINATRTTEITSPQANLLGVWNLNEGTGGSLADNSGNVVTGATVGGQTWVTGFPDPTSPAAPINLAASTLGQTVNLNWNLNSESDLAGYNVYRSTSPSVPLTNPINGGTPVAGALYSDGGRSNGVQYYYVVTAVDTSANQSTASNEVSATPLASNGSALQFNGTNNYVTFGTGSILASPTYTVETWFKRTGLGVGITTGTGGIASAIPLVTKGTSEGETANADINYFLGIDANSGVLIADFEEGAGGASPSLNHPVSGTTIISNNVWYHAAVTYDGTTLRLYLNGVQQNFVTVGQPTASATTSPTAFASSIRSNGTTIQGYFNGVLDEVRIWNVARTQSEIQNNKNSELTSGTGLVARWGINEGSGTTVNSSVSSFPGTLTNGPVWVAGFVPPAVNQAPNVPTVDAPSNGATGIGTSPTLNVGVSDPDNNPLTVTFFGRPYASGLFAQFAQNPGVASGTNTTVSWNSLGAGQKFEWYVTVSDGIATTTGPTWTFETTPSTDPVFVGAGDIAECSITDDTATGNIIQGVAGTVFTTGDNVYPNGTAADFANCYATTPWGDPSILSRTRPVPGNHDWGTGATNNLNGYFGYYGANATDAGGQSYYSYDINANWHVVNLDTECQLVPGGCGVGSPQEIWLKADLAANTNKNVIALWHKPRYSSGATNYQTIQPLWDALYAAGVDILLDGHDHIYERLAPMKSGAALSDPPVADPLYGIRQFTIGTGGEGHHGLSTTLPTSEIRNDTTFGILKLTLHATTYDWQFLPIAGSTFTDSGTGTVHGPPPVCYALTLGHMGNGSTPTTSPANSAGCPTGQYVLGEAVGLSGASPNAGWQIDSWYGTDNNASTGNTNSLSMPANAHAAGVNYSAIPGAGAALQFDGTNEYVTFGTGNTLAAPTYTVETWFKRTGAGVGVTTGTGGIALAIPLITKGTSENEAANVDINYFLGIDANTGVLIADFEEGAGGAAPSQNHPVSGTTVISNDAWYHAAVTYDGTTLKLYLNGVQENSLTVGQPAASATTAPTAFASSIRSNGTTIQGYFNGVLDEARIWNVARTQTEIQNAINSELTSGTGLIGRWGMNEGAGTTITDSTAPAENGTLTNGPVWVSPGAPFNLNYNGAPLVNAGADQVVPLQDNVELSGSVSDDGLPNPPGTVTTTWSLVSGPGTVTFANANAPSTTGSFSANGTYVLRLTANDGDKTSSDDVTITISPVTNNGLDLGGTASGAYVTFGDPAKLDLAQFTIETWFKRTGTGVTNTTGSNGIPNAIPLVTHGAPEADGSNLDANWILAIDDSTDVIAADFEDTATGANHPVLGTTPITNNVWHHAAVTYDGTTWRLYLDGNLEATLAANAAPRSDSIQRSSLGAMITSTGTALGRFQGTIDEARVWNRALTLAEIQANINSELTTGTGLVARWGLNESSGTTVSDSVATLAPGTVSGANYAWVAGAPFNILINNPPAAPVLSSPANNATGVPTSPTLDVSVSDPDGGNLNVTFYGRPASSLPTPGPDFTIIALPDTQYYTSSLNGGSPAIFNSQTDWIVNNIASRKIVFVTQLGDCTEHGDQFEIEWQNADTAFQTIENPVTTNMTYGMPYGIAPGNHDQSPIGNANGTTTFYNQYFGEARFLGRDYYGGHYGTNNDNHYELFNAGGLDFIVIHLEYDTAANASVLAWADDLLQTYSNRRGIVVSHHIINAGFNATFSTQGQATYNALRDNPNLFLMLSGHVSPPEGQRTDTYQGNTIYSLMSDYQGRTNGGNGWLRIMTFSPANNTIQVQTYSPWLNQFETDADSQFTIAYDMQGGADPFTVIDTTTVPSGSHATITWPGLTTGTPYEWYATVSDGSTTATSSTNTFTTAAQTYTLATNTVGNGTVTKSPDQASYNAGGIVTLTASPAADSTFTGWSGDASGSTNPLNITMDGNKSITATFAINTFTLNYAAGTGGTLTGVTSQTVNYGEDGTAVTAVPNTGYHFVNWSDSSTDNPRTDTNVTTNLDVTANFAVNTFTLNYSAGAGGSLTGTTSQTVNYGEDGTLVEAVPNTGYHFVNWSDNSTVNPRTDTNVTSNISVTANFAIDTFTLNYAAGTGGTLTGDTSQTVNYGEDGTTVTAVPNTGYHFVDWSDGVLTVTRTDENVIANLSVTATFAPDTFTLEYAAGTNGTLTGDVSQTATYGGNGTPVTAVPNAGYHFVDWSDSSTDNPRTDTNVTANLSVTANFAQNTFTLNVTVAGSGTVMKNPDQATYPSGSTVGLTATAAPGWMFSGWSGDASGNTNPLNVTMDGDKSITATFTQNTYTLDVTIVGQGSVTRNPDSASYIIGSVVELTATAAPGWTFSGWSGDASGSTNPLSVTMDGNKSITATFTQNTYTLDVAMVGNGTVTRNNDGPYHFNDEVILTATPASGWTFSGWSGDASGSANQVTVSIDGNKSVTATFLQSEYTLTILTEGNGTVTRSADGPYHLNDQVTLTAVPATGWAFTGWSGSGCSGTGTCIVTMDDHKTVTAVFTPIEYALTVNITGNGTVTKNPDQATYHYGDIVELTAVAGSGWTFDSWGGALSGNTNPQYVTVNGDTTVSAAFTQNSYTLAVTVLGSGTVSKSPDQPNYLSGSVVQLTATAAPGWTFSGWSGDASGNTNPLNVTMDGNKSITATFTQITYTLDVTIVGNGSVTKNPDQAAYSSGSTVEITAAAAPGWQFSGWSGDASGSTNPLNVTMNGNTSITATFTVIPSTCYPLTLSHTGQGSDPTASPASSAGCSTGQYVAGASINLSGAVPTAGWQISGWTGTNNNPSTASTNSVTMPASAHAANVSYTQIEYSLTVNIGGSGSVAKSPNQTTYHYGDIVQLTATPSSGWIFTSWSGDASGSTNPVNVTMNGNSTVTATFTLNDLIFEDGFSSCNATSWSSTVGSGLTFPASAAYNSNCGMAVAITTNNPTYVRDNTPNLETRYRARFYFNPNGMSMGKNDAHFIFGSYSATNSNMLVVELRRTGSSLQVRAGLLNDRSKWSYTAWSTISSGWNAIEFDWRAATAAGANNGGLTLWLNGTQVANLTGVDNDLQKVDWIALGAVNAIDSATRGTYYFDAFESRRQNYIGP